MPIIVPPVDVTTPTVAGFRAMFPAFADTTKYPDVTVAMWLATAAGWIDQCRWGTMYVFGVYLFTAHYLTVMGSAAGSGGAAATGGGLVSAKAVDKVSVSYDVSATTIKDGGFWNMSPYGVQFWTFARLFGMGGFQL